MSAIIEHRQLEIHTIAWVKFYTILSIYRTFFPVEFLSVVRIAAVSSDIRIPTVRHILLIRL